ncbi:DNA invertase Pin-like site-specific DNA recombinase [Xanthomonas arboricola]|nr:DNA invertase Pin-like site-specific DNA recombinase [Xanthomonas sp. 3793]
MWRQEERAKAFAERHGLEIVDRFDDFGVSAFRGKNAHVGALGDFIKHVERGEIERGSYLLVESMDRLSRADVHQALTLLLNLMALGVSVAILDDGQIYRHGVDNAQTSLLIALVSMTRAHEESKRKSEMLSAAWKRKREYARAEGKVTTSRVPGWLRVVDGRVEQIPQRCVVVREIFTLARDGYGAYSISRLLNERKEKPWSTRKNAVWRESYVKKILMSRTVLGEYQPHIVSTESGKQKRVASGAPLRDYYPEIVSPTLFQEANNAVDARRIIGKGRKGARYANVFTGLLRCSCGAGVRFIDKGDGPKGGTYLQCSVSLARGSCGARTFAYSLIEELLLNTLDKLDVSELIGGTSAATKASALRAQLAMCEAEEAGIKLALERIKGSFMSPFEMNPSGDSANLLTWLRETEARQSEVLSRRKLIEEEQMSLTQVDPQQWRETVAQLKTAIADDRDPEVGKKRRALGAELQRVLKKITLADIRREGFEIAQEYESDVEIDPEPSLEPLAKVATGTTIWRDLGETRGWKEVFGVRSLSGLNKLARQRSFDLRIEYKSGEVVHLDPLLGQWYRSKKSIKMKNLEFKAKGVIENN